MKINEEAYGSYGMFEHADITAHWTDEDWAKHDEHVATELALFDNDYAEDFAYEYHVGEPPF